MKLSIALLLAFVAVASASTSSSFFLTGKIPEGWTMHKRVAADEDVPITIAVKLNNVADLERHIDEISDPQHARYGDHMTIDEINELTSNWEATGRIYTWLLSEGVDAESIRLSRGGDFVHVTMKADQAERVLDASFHHFEHQATGLKAIRTPIYRLPGSIKNLVDFVSGSTLFPTTAPRAVRSEIEAVEGVPIPAGYVTPQLLTKFYKVDNTVVASQDATQSVYENLGQSYDEADLNAFQQQFGLHQNKVTKVIGPNTPSECSTNSQNCGEALLDVEYMMALAQDAPTTYWSIPNGNTPFLDWIMAVAQADDAPLVHSISYGDIEPMSDASTMQRVNTEIGKLAARGITVFASSGDDGVFNFQARGDPSKCDGAFVPSFPATAPYITAVGATMGAESNQAEVACTSDAGGIITTGGGFSTVFDQPSYQKQAVENYLNSGPSLPSSDKFVATGRGYPDVAFAGYNFVIAIAGKLTAESGTSASSPSFAALITLINGKRIAAGKKPLGFLNPVLYQIAQSNPAVFNDITSGRNNCAAGAKQGQPHAAVCCSEGFTATTGWDPLTGLGTPNFDALSAALMQV